MYTWATIPQWNLHYQWVMTMIVSESTRSTSTAHSFHWIFILLMWEHIVLQFRRPVTCFGQAEMSLTLQENALTLHTVEFCSPYRIWKSCISGQKSRAKRTLSISTPQMPLAPKIPWNILSTPETLVWNNARRWWTIKTSDPSNIVRKDTCWLSNKTLLTQLTLNSITTTPLTQLTQAKNTLRPFSITGAKCDTLP